MICCCHDAFFGISFKDSKRIPHPLLTGKCPSEVEGSERGVNENTNGLARQYIPKGSDFDQHSEEHITEIEWKLNHRPRKSLVYLTPLEYFKKLYNFDFGSRCTSI